MFGETFLDDTIVGFSANAFRLLFQVQKSQLNLTPHPLSKYALHHLSAYKVALVRTILILLCPT